MKTYRLYDLALGTSLPFPELDPTEGRPDLTLVCDPLQSVPDRWEDLWSRRDGEPWVRVQRVGEAYRIRYVDQVEFQYTPAGRRIVAEILDCPSGTFRHFFLDQVVPLILGLDSLVLHASAAVVDDRVVALIGKAGAGKSTLAAQLERRGHAVAADDGLLIRPGPGGLVAVPSYGGLRLWPDALAMLASPASDGPVTDPTAKRRVRSGLRLDGRVRRLGTAFVLDGEASDAISIEPMSVRDGTVALLEHTFCLERHFQQQLVDHLERVCGVGRVLQISRLRYPRRQDCWAAVIETIERYAVSGRDAAAS